MLHFYWGENLQLDPAVYGYSLRVLHVWAVVRRLGSVMGR